MTYLAIGPWQIIVLLFVLGFMILPVILALIDILRNEFSGNDKIVWVLVVLFGNIIGALLYFTIGRKQKVKQ